MTEAKLNASMEHIRTALELIVKGRRVEPEVMAEALAELKVAEALAAERTCNDMVFLAPDVSQADESMLRLGHTYLILQQFLQEMFQEGHFKQVNGKVADCLIATHAFLLKNNFELKHVPTMTFKHVVHKETK